MNTQEEYRSTPMNFSMITSEKGFEIAKAKHESARKRSMQTYASIA